MHTFQKRFDRLERAALQNGRHNEFLDEAMPALSAFSVGQYSTPLPGVQGAVQAGERAFARGQCSSCGEFDGLVRCDEAGEYVCVNCGVCEHIHENTGRTASYAAIRDAVPHYAYKRANHFRDWLQQCNGQECTLVPEEVMEAVKRQASRYRIALDKLTARRVRGFLKTLGYAKHYENAQQICDLVSGRRCVRMTLQQMDKLQHMFLQMQEPFDQARADLCPERKNFLSYSYVLHKLCDLLGYDEFLQRFPLLKSQAPLQQQDALWKHMCRSLRWEFIPST